MLLTFIIIDKGEVTTQDTTSIIFLNKKNLSEDYIVYASININESGRIKENIEKAKKYAKIIK